MRYRGFLRASVLGLAAAIALGVATTAPSSAQSTNGVNYRVTIENVTEGQPFTPPVVAAHSQEFDVFLVGQAASEGVMQIAENGNNDPLVAQLTSSAAVSDHAVGQGAIGPGQSATLSVEAPPGSRLSVIFMLICTNDGFSGVDSLALPATGSQTVETNAYDAGTERNTEDFVDIVPPCQELVGVTSEDEGTGMSNPALAEGGVIAMHPGIEGGADLTVADHGWTDPVARITVAAEAAALPSTGTGVADSGDTSPWVVAVAAVGAALFVAGGALAVARRSVR